MALSVCRDGAVLELAVRVGAEDGLGTPLLVHWAGAQLQVRAPQTLNPNPKPSWARRKAWARRCWCNGPARSCRCGLHKP